MPIGALPGMRLAEAQNRFARVHATLAESVSGSSVTVGFAEMRGDDSVSDLVARADAALYRQRKSLRA